LPNSVGIYKKIIEKNGNALYTSFELAEAIEAMSEQ